MGLGFPSGSPVEASQQQVGGTTWGCGSEHGAQFRTTQSLPLLSLASPAKAGIFPSAVTLRTGPPHSLSAFVFRCFQASKRITPFAACRCLPLPTEAGPAQTAWSGWGICRHTVGVMTQTPSASRNRGPRASSVTSSGRSCSICFKSTESALPGTCRN